MPHAFYDTIVVIPVLYYACVVEVNEVETVECRILACEFIHLLCILRIPVYISHRTGKSLLSEILHQVSIELLGCLCSIGVTQVRSNVKQFCIPVVVSTGRETECILRSEIIRTVTHRRLHDLNLIIRGSLCMQRNNQLITLSIRKGIIHIIKGGVIGIYFNRRVRSCVYRLIVCDNHIDEGIEFRSSIFWRN